MRIKWLNICKSFEQGLVPSKHSVSASYEYYAIIVFLSKLVAVVGSSPSTESCVELLAP